MGMITPSNLADSGVLVTQAEPWFTPASPDMAPAGASGVFFDAAYYLAHNPDVAAAGVDPLRHYQTIGWKEGRDPSATFSTRAYLAVYPDAAAAGTDPLTQFLASGQAQGRLPRPDIDFDRAYYLAHNPDVAASGTDPFVHFLTFGWKEGRNPSALFDIKYYLAQNPDVAAAGINPLLHYETSGWKEGRNPSAAFNTRAFQAAYSDSAGSDPVANDLATGLHRLGNPAVDFDPAYYLAHNPDVAAAGVDPFSHYMTIGWKEGRDPNALFNTRYYLAQNPDVAAAGVNPLLHYETTGFLEGRDPGPALSLQAFRAAYPGTAGIDPLPQLLAPGHAGLVNPAADFDRAYYLAQNPDVAAAGVDPFTHYMTIGWKEGRNPNAFFNTRFYLAQNPDVAAAGINPLLHYETFGWHEGRDPSAVFSTHIYLASYSDVRAAGLDPLQHFLQYGRAEGRSPGGVPGTAPTATLETAFRADNTGTLTAAPTVALVGHADPGATVTVAGTSLSAVAGVDGSFRITGVPLALGSNSVTLTAVDAQGHYGSASIALTRAADAGSTVVSDWDQQTLDAVVAYGADPQYTSRAMALESIAVLDVLNAIQGKAGFLVSLAAPAGINADAATAAAAHDMLAYLFPTRTPVLDAALARTLAGLPAGAATDQGVAFGKSIAAAEIAIRDRDGWNKVVVVDGNSTPGQWRPTTPDFALAQDPQWASVTPFVLTSDSQFRAPPPPALGSAEYLAGVAQVQSLGSLTSTTRTADQTQIAKFWADGAGTVTPAGHWNTIARQIVTSLGLDAATQARILAEVDVALADASFAAWDTKYAYTTERPISTIRNGDGGVAADPSWTPLIKTPPHPSYVSGHSTYSNSAAAVLDSIFGTNFAFSTTSPGLAGVTRSFTGFDAAAAEAAISRVYGGIHYIWDSNAGLVIGTQVGNAVISAFEQPADNGPVLLLDQTGASSTAGSFLAAGFALDSTSPITAITASLDGGAAVGVAVSATGRFAISADMLFGTVAAGAHSLTLAATDSGGHVSTLAVPFTRGIGGVSIGISAPATNGIITAGAHLTGTATSTAGTVTSLTYQFDNGTPIPMQRGADGSFDTALDLSALSAGAHTLTVKATDSAGGAASVSSTETLQSLVPLVVTGITPANGAADIGVTYRPVVSFSRAVDVTTLTASSLYATDSSGAVLAATIVPAGDGTSASLFFSGPMPSASTVTIHVVGTLIKGAGDGMLLDAAKTGTPGSVATSSLVTVSTTALPTTILTGIIADPGTDLQPNSADDVINNPNGTKTYKNPIAHAKVYVIGQEDQAVYTDANGSFTLTGVPSGNVKVVVDGRTATNAPAGIYFPEMTLDTTITAGATNTIPGSMGTPEEMAAHQATYGVFLPRVFSSILQPVSATETTVVTVPAEAGGLLSDAQRTALTLTVAPGSIVGSDGQPLANAQVGISPVPSDIVKDMLPAGLLQHSFDITIQVPDGAQFTTPAQLTLPNVFGLAPGEKTYILSFDHTTGRLVIDGTATASADGLTVTTDPGQGVTKPGWHGVTPPGSESSGPGDGPSTSTSSAAANNPCNVATQFKKDGLNLLKNALDCAKQLNEVTKVLGDLLKNTADLLDQANQAKGNYDALVKAKADYATAVTNGSDKDAQAAAANIMTAKAQLLNNGCSSLAAAFGYARTTFEVETFEVNTAVTCISAFLDFAANACNNLVSDGCLTVVQSAVICNSLNVLSSVLKVTVDAINLDEKHFFTGGIQGLCDAIAHVVNETTVFTNPNGDLLPSFSLLAADGFPDAPPPSPDPMGGADLTSLQAALDAVGSSFASVLPQLSQLVGDGAATAALPGVDGGALATAAAAIERAAFGTPADVFYEIKVGAQVYRGTTDGSGQLSFFFPPTTAFTINYYDPANDLYATYNGTSAASGSTTVLPNPLFLSIADLPTTGLGGLPDLVEEIVGGTLTKADNLVAGVRDVIAVHQGVAATRSLSNTSGVIGTAALNGEARAVVVAGASSDPTGQYAYVATGSYGLAILDVNSPLKPNLLSETRLAGGTAVDVATDAGLGVAAVADGAGGLVLLNVVKPASPSVISTAAGEVRAVLIKDGVVYATSGTSVIAVDAATGTLLQALTIGTSTLQGLARDGSTLWAIDTSGTLTGVAIGTGQMVRIGTFASFAGNTNPVKLYAAAGVLYVPTGSTGYKTIDVSNPAAPRLLADSANSGNGAIVDAIALNGAGIGVAIAGARGTTTLEVVDTSNPANNTTVLTRFNLPATPYDVAISGGVAYVADGTGGLQVVNYKPTDLSGVGPAITVTQGPGGAAAGAGTVSLAEGSLAGFQFTLTDPGQIRDVALLVNGVVALDDSSYPFELAAALPSLAATPSGTVTLSLRATDTAGLVSTTAPVTVTLTPDNTTPALLDQTLAAGSVHAGSFRSFTYRFSKPIDAASLTTANFTLVGPAGAVVPTSIQSRAGGLQVVVTYPTLVPGSYTSTLVASGITDRAGHALGATPLTTAFTVAAGSYTTEWTSLVSGKWSNAYSWEAGSLPVASDKVLLSLPTGVVVTHDSGTDEIAGLAISAGELAMTGGTLTVNGALDAIGGTLTLAGGTLANAAIQAEAGTVLFKSIALSNVSVSTAMTVRGNVTAYGSFTLTGPTLDLLTTDYSGNRVAAQTSLTLDSIAISLGATPTSINSAYGYSSLTAGGSLVLGKNVVVTDSTASLGRSDSLEGGATLSNAGQILVSNNAGLLLRNMSNTGTVSATGGARLTLAGTFANAGTFAADAASSVTLSGTTTLADLASVTGGSALVVSGTVALNGAAYDAGALPGFGSVTVQNGTLRGGSVRLSALPFTTMTLDDVALLGDIRLNGQNLYLTNPHAFTGSAIDMRAGSAANNGSSYLSVTGDLALNGVAVTMGRNDAASYGSSSLSLSGTLTLGATTTVTGNASGSIAASLVNAGVITGPFNLYGTSIVNSGQINLQYDYTLSSQGVFGYTSLQNSGAITTSGGGTRVTLYNLANTGTVRIGAGDQLTLSGNTFSNTGTLDIGASGLTVQTNMTLATLQSIKASGASLVLSSGTFDLGGGTLSAATLPGYASIALRETVRNGTIVQDANLTVAGAVLDNTSWTSGLRIKTGSLTATTALSVSGGALDATSGYDSVILTLNGLTLSGMTLNTGATASGYYTNVQGGSIVATALTLAADTTWNAMAGRTAVSGKVVNNGQINLAAGARFEIGSDTISGSGTVAVTAGSTVALQFLTSYGQVTGLSGFSGSGATLAVQGTTLDLAGGTLNAATVNASFSDMEFDSVTVKNGTLRSGARTLLTSGATLDTVALEGAFAVTGSTSLKSVSTTAGVSIQLGAADLYSSAYLSFTVAQTLDRWTIALTGNGAIYSSSTLSVAATSSITGLSGRSLSLSGAILNAGVITTAGQATISGGSFTNSGTLAVTGQTTAVQSSSFVNTGAVTVAAGATLNIQSAMTGGGTLTVNGTATINTGVTLAGLGTVGGTGMLTLYNSLALGNGTLNVGGGGIASLVLRSSTSDGTLHVGAGGVLTFGSGATLARGVITTANGSTVQSAALVTVGAATVSGDTVQFGPDGSNVTFMGPGAVSTPGAAFLFSAGDHDTIVASSQAESYYYRQAPDVFGFNRAGGDVLDVSAFLAGTAWDHTVAGANNYLSYGYDGSTLVISGSGGSGYYGSGTLARLHNMAGVTLTDLEAGNSIRLS